MDFYDVIAVVFHYHYQWNKRDEAVRNRVALLEHLDYIAALRNRDAAATEAACRRHLASARATLLASITDAAASPPAPEDDRRSVTPPALRERPPRADRERDQGAGTTR